MNLKNILTIGLTLWLTACAGGMGHKPVMNSYSYQGNVNKALKALMTAGYEIKSKDLATGVIQGMRPMKGAFARPGYGHNFVVSVEKGSVTINVMSIEGVLGGESPELVRDEIVRMLSINQSLVGANALQTPSGNAKVESAVAAKATTCIVSSSKLNVRDVSGQKVKTLQKGDQIVKCQALDTDKLPAAYSEGSLANYQWGQGMVSGETILFAWKFISQQ